MYFIGIGGIGMSAIARYFHAQGKMVSGYDKTRTALTTQLETEGIAVHYTEDLSSLPKDADLVVFTPAVPSDQAELVYYRDHGYRVVKRSDVLQAITAASFNICVGGTHGKTTVSTMIAHILRHSGYGCNAFLGGIAVNYQTNFWSSEKEVCVIEADEYDRSFLKLNPDVAVITAMDADHLDIYGNEKNMQDAFVAFGNRVKPGGWLIAKLGLKRIREVQAGRKLAYSLQNDAADAYARDIRTKDGVYQFDLCLPGERVLPSLHLNIGGMHNVENAVVAMTVASVLGIEEEKIREAVAAFKGVKRRFEYVIPPVRKQEGGYVAPVLIDDYAHHPEELRPLLNSVRSLFPQRVLTVVFQPHLFSRTKDFADGFAEVLSLADQLLLLPIYPARELPVEGVTSELILDRATAPRKEVLTKEDLLDWMRHHVLDRTFGEVIVMAGAGDIDALVPEVKKIIEQSL
ncbi:MAG: UDP-N-acetylmuramate--L-alanine ligase [Flavisolibacter sp.]